jgi:hypothetical protein
LAIDKVKVICESFRIRQAQLTVFQVTAFVANVRQAENLLACLSIKVVHQPAVYRRFISRSTHPARLDGLLPFGPRF